MRLSMLASLILLLTTLPVWHSQSDYPPCTAKNLQSVISTAPDYDVLRMTASSINSLDDALDYAQKQLTYRDSVWDMAPRCAESIDFFWQTTREANYIAAYWAMHYGIRAVARGNPDFMEDYNPFIDPLDEAFYPETYNATIYDLRDRLQDLGQDEDSMLADLTLPRCSESQLAGLAPVLPEYQGIIADSKAIASVDDLLDLAHRHYAWRENWAHESQIDLENNQILYTQRDGVSDLPPCQEAVELLWLMYRAVNDVVTGTALIYAGFTAENHPYFEVFNHNADRVDELARLINSSQADPSAPTENWPVCTKEQRTDFEHSRPAYNAFHEALSTTRASEVLVAIGRAEIAWRQSLWSHQPACAKDVEKILMLSQAAANIVAGISFVSISVPDETNPYLEEMHLSMAQLDSFPAVLSAISLIDESPLLMDSCTDADFDALSALVAHYRILEERMIGFGGMDGLLPLLDHMIEWRDDLLLNLPACNLSFEMGLQMSYVIDDYAAFIGLIYAEAPDDSIPYLKTYAENRLDLLEKIERGAVDLESGPPLWTYGGQLPACSKAESSALSAMLSEYQALITTARQIRELDELLDFGAGQVAWRETAWRRLPTCAEALELGLFLQRAAGDYFPLYAFQVQQDSLSQTISGGHRLGERLDEIIVGRLGAQPDERAISNTHGLPRCSDAETDRILGIFADFQTLLDLGTSYTRWGGFPEYIDARLALREKVNAEMPDCLIGLDLTLAVAQNVASSLVQLIPGVGSVDMANSVLHEQLAARIAEGPAATDAGFNARPYRNNLPACSGQQLDDLLNNSELDPAKLRQTIIAIGAPDTSFADIDKEVARYEHALSKLPRCAQATEFAMLFRQILSDPVAWKALETAGAADDSNPYALQPDDVDILQNRLDEFADASANGEQSPVPASQDDSLPRCTNAELATLRALIKEYQVITRLAVDSESIDELLHYVEPHREWRLDFWSRLPGCIEAYEAGLPTTRTANNLVAYYSFEIVGYPILESQFGRQLAVDSYFMFNWLRLLDKGDRGAMDAFMRDPVASGM